MKTRISKLTFAAVVVAMLTAAILLAQGPFPDKVVRSVNTMTGLVQVNPNSADNVVAVEGLTQTGDAGAGMFYFDRFSSATPNASNVFQVVGFPGRWIRLFGGASAPGITSDLWTTNGLSYVPVQFPQFLQITNNGAVWIGTNTLLESLNDQNSGSPDIGMRRTASLGDSGNYLIDIGSSMTGSVYNLGTAFVLIGHTNSMYMQFGSDDETGNGPFLYLSIGYEGSRNCDFGVIDQLNGGTMRFDTVIPNQTFLIKNGTTFPNADEIRLEDSTGSVNFKVSSVGLVTSTNGFSSLSTDAPVAISAAGWTNTFGKAATSWTVGTNVTYTLYNNAGIPIRTNIIAAGTTVPIDLQAGAKFIVTAGSVAGSAVPF